MGNIKHVVEKFLEVPVLEVIFVTFNLFYNKKDNIVSKMIRSNKKQINFLILVF